MGLWCPTKQECLALQSWEQSAKKDFPWLVPQSYVRSGREYKWTRAGEDHSPVTPQQRGMLGVPFEFVFCLSLEYWGQGSLQTWLASKALNVCLLWLSLSPQFSLLERCFSTWSPSKTASHGAYQCLISPKIRRYIASTNGLALHD